MGFCKSVVLFVLTPLLLLVLLLSQESGRHMYISSIMKLKRDFLLPSIQERDGQVVADPIIGKVMKLLSVPYHVSVLASATADFRRVMFFQCRDISGGYGVEYGPWANGLAQFSHKAVAEDQMNKHQQRGAFFGGLTVGGSGADVPYECMSGWQLMISSDDPKHTRVREILHEAVDGLRVDPHVKRSLLVPPGLPEDADAVEGTMIANIVAMNLWSRMFGLEGWSEELEALFTEYGAKGALCAVGVYSGDKDRVAAIVNEVAAHIDRTKVGAEIRKISSTGETKLDGDKVMNMIAFGFLFAGVGGTSHLTTNTVLRIRSDPALYLPMWQKNPRNFLVEQARIDPPVTSYNSLLPQDVTTQVMGKSMLLKKGTNRQMFIATANRDPRVFADPDTFNPDRANLDQVLSWNGPEDMVGLGKAPRGCPGHDLAQLQAKLVVNLLLPSGSKPTARSSEL